MMGKIRVSVLLGLLFSAVTGNRVWAQSTAQINGAITDTSGAVLPGVEVTATQTATGLVRTAISNETGSYTLPNLPVGPYKLEAALSGFRTFVQTGIVLQVGSAPVINPVLAVGQVTEQVEVQADAALVETRTAGVGQVIDLVCGAGLPLGVRDVLNLGNPNLVLSDVGNFGRVLSTATGNAGDPRIMQLALKFVF